jgi:hypothetical protein
MYASMKIDKQLIYFLPIVTFIEVQTIYNEMTCLVTDAIYSFNQLLLFY